VARDAGANAQVSASIDEQLADFGVAGVLVRRGPLTRAADCEWITRLTGQS